MRNDFKTSFEVYAITIFRGFTLWDIERGVKLFEIPLFTSKQIYINNFYFLSKSSLVFEITRSMVVVYDHSNLKDYQMITEH